MDLAGAHRVYVKISPEYEMIAARKFARTENYIPEPNSGCWLWLGAQRGAGYGCLEAWRGGVSKKVLAHRASFISTNGPIPDGLVIDHICRNRLCVNPSHLRVVTRRINNIENSDSVGAVAIRKTHCNAGHEFNEVNSYISRSGKRICRPCHREKVRRLRKKVGTVQK